MFDELAIEYVLGGSIASSFFGEPRATADVDVAVTLDPPAGERFLARAATEFYVPSEAATTAIETRDSFNLIDTSIPFKVDVFVLGDALLDRRQMERRIRVLVPSTGEELWVTSPEDQVLRKLEWFRAGGEISDQQWRDIAGLLRIGEGRLDLDYLWTTAEAVELTDLLERAMRGR
ncbi:MAG: hypothetical protein R2746_03280 [Acidimicrobiales bacterium]